MWTETEAAQTITFPGAGEPGTPGGELFSYLSESRAVEPQRQGMPRVPPASGTYFGAALRTHRAPGPPLAKFVGHRCRGDNAGHAGRSRETAQSLPRGGSVLGLKWAGKRAQSPRLTATTPGVLPSFLRRPHATAPLPHPPRSQALLVPGTGFPCDVDRETSCSRAPVRGFRFQFLLGFRGLRMDRPVPGEDGAGGLYWWSEWRGCEGPGDAVYEGPCLWILCIFLLSSTHLFHICPRSCNQLKMC